MTIEEIEKYFGSLYAVYKECGFSAASPYHWKKKGYIPASAQLKIERITNGSLRASLDDGFSRRYKYGNERE